MKYGSKKAAGCNHKHNLTSYHLASKGLSSAGEYQYKLKPAKLK